MATKKTTDFKVMQDFADQAGRVFEPAQQFNAMFAANLEKLARFQYELAGDWLQLGLDQLNATVKAKDLGTLASRQSEIAGKFVEKASLRQQEFTKLSTDAQAALARWVEDATDKAAKAAA